MKKVLFSLFVLAGFAACTSDDVVISESTGITSDTAEAYLTVNIKYADQGGTRATSTGFADATAAEYAVSDAFFYFFDENGLFVSRAEVWDDVANNYTGADPTANVQIESSTVVVLKGLTEKGYPRYMVTVLNEPADFENGYNGLYHEAAGTLDEFIEKLAYGEYGAYNDEYTFNENAGIIAPYNGEDYFVMSTTSFVGPDADNRGGISPYYFTTRLDDSDFYEEPVSAENTNAVDVYVERLAAKVSATYGGTTSQIDVIDGEGNTSTINAYPVTEKMSIAGEANADDEAGNTEYTGEHEGDETIYIALDGWKLNATARQSYISKNIDTSWTYTWNAGGDSGNDWNDASNSRSYWGMAYLYGKEGDTEFEDGDTDQHNGYPVSSRTSKTTYPTTAGADIDVNQQGNYDVDELDPATWLNGYVKYTSLADGTMNAFTADITETSTDVDYEYCAENTNTVGEDGIVNNLNSSAITSALIKATAYTRVDGTDYYTAQTLIRFDGLLFTESAFNAYIYQDIITEVNKSEGEALTTYGISSVASIYEGESIAQLADGSQAPVPGETLSGAMTADQLNQIMVDSYGYEGNYTEALVQLFSKDDITWVNEGSGNISVHADIEEGNGETSGGQWTWIVETNEEGATTYTFVDDYNGQSDLIASIQEYVEEFNTTNTISAYLDGKMYYTVPIEHLNNTAGTTETLVAGQYGVVRNHWYNLTISAVDRIGKGIIDDNEVIVPEPEDPTYLYVQATINILSWKSVEQDVTLGQY